MNLVDFWGRTVVEGDYYFFSLPRRGTSGMFGVKFVQIQNGTLIDYSGTNLETEYRLSGRLLGYKLCDADKKSASVIQTATYNPDTKKRLVDLAGRPLQAGDFVWFTKATSMKSLKFGVVVNSTQVYTQDGALLEPIYVYKIENPLQKEAEVFNKIKSAYMHSRVSSLTSKNVKTSLEELEIGDIFQKGNTISIYLGRYKIDVIDNSLILGAEEQTLVKEPVDIWYHLSLVNSTQRKTFLLLRDGNTEGVTRLTGTLRDPIYIYSDGAKRRAFKIAYHLRVNLKIDKLGDYLGNCEGLRNIKLSLEKGYNIEDFKLIKLK